jgi:hypothetical protein
MGFDARLAAILHDDKSIYINTAVGIFLAEKYFRGGL